MFKIDWFGEQAIADMQRVLGDAVEDVTKDVEAGAESVCPVGETGKLKASIDTSFFSEEGVEIGYVTVGNDEAFYAPFVEMGTSDMVARPFMRTAIRSNKAGGQQKLVNAVKKVLD